MIIYVEPHGSMTLLNSWQLLTSDLLVEIHHHFVWDCAGYPTVVVDNRSQPIKERIMNQTLFIVDCYIIMVFCVVNLGFWIHRIYHNNHSWS